MGAAAGLLCATLVLAGCGSGDDDLVGTWSAHDPDDGATETLQIFDNGEANLDTHDTECQGKLDTDSEPYQLKLDCGVTKAIATLKLSDDAKSLEITIGGDKETFTHGSAGSPSPDDS